MIEFKNVTKSFNENIALKNVNVKISDGDFVFLVGPSGAGKSTFINLLLKVTNADRGNIIYNGYDVTKLPNRLIPKHRRSMGIIYQNFSLLPKKTVYENVAFAMQIIQAPKKMIKKRVVQVIKLVGLPDKMDKYPDQLSIGEQQRVAIARAIVNNPDVLIADEPTGNLDPVTGWEIMTLLEEINKRGTTVVMVTHSQEIVDSMEKRVVAIVDGEIISDKEIAKYHMESLKNVPESASFIRRKNEFFKKPVPLEKSEPMVEKVIEEAEAAAEENASEKGATEGKGEAAESKDLTSKKTRPESRRNRQFDSLIRDTYRGKKPIGSGSAGSKKSAASSQGDSGSKVDARKNGKTKSQKMTQRAENKLKETINKRPRKSSGESALTLEELGLITSRKPSGAIDLEDLTAEKKPITPIDTGRLIDRFEEEELFSVPDFLEEKDDTEGGYEILNEGLGKGNEEARDVEE
jgi:cell division transport system ATP-binding protein